MMAYGSNTVFFEKHQTRHNNVVKKDFFTVIAYFLILFGIDIDASCKSRLKTVLLRISKALAISLFVLLVGVELHSLHTNRYTVDFKIYPSSRLVGALGILLWYNIQTSRMKIIDAIGRIRKFSEAFDIGPSWKFQIACMLWLLLVQSAGMHSYFHYHKMKKLIEQFLFQVLHIRGNTMMMLIISVITTLYVFFFFTFPVCVVTAYITSCRCLEKTLKRYADQIFSKEEASLKVFEESARLYHSVVETLHSCESTFSFPIFLIAVSSAARIYLNILVTLSSEMPHNIFLACEGISIFAVISASAAMVNEADEYARRANDRLLQQVSVPLPDVMKVVRFFSTNSGPSFAFTGWGVFKFTKSFLLAALGSVVTYSLLFISIQA